MYAHTHTWECLSCETVRGEGCKSGHLISYLTSSFFVLCLRWSVIRLETYTLPLNYFTSRYNWLQHSLHSLLFLLIFSTPESGKSCRSSPYSPIVCWENDYNFCLFGFYEIGYRGPDWLQILHSPSVFPVLELQACTRMPSNFHEFLNRPLIIMFIGPNYSLISTLIDFKNYTEGA